LTYFYLFLSLSHSPGLVINEKESQPELIDEGGQGVGGKGYITIDQ
jgi:hypothetical protein